MTFDLIFWKTVTTFDFDDIYILKEHTLTYQMVYDIAV
jgi:hypothetical protein